METAIVTRRKDCETVDAEWGTLTWYANRQLGNSADMTVGECRIGPGHGNPLHSHPNCSEILVVRQGVIRHTTGQGQDVQLNPGDVITIPANVAHRAENVSSTEAVLLLAFSSADRRTRGE